MKQNPLITLEALGQSIWLDYIKRDLITSGKLKSFISDDGLGGMTSNPSIFEEAIGKSNLYDPDIQMLQKENKDLNTIYETLTQRDVRDAADVFRPVFDTKQGLDGFVSLEVNPHLAHNTQGTIEEARRLWASLDRPNVLIKVPGTPEGLPAIQQLISEGINVNVTLLFGLPRYREVAQAYIAGLEARVAKNQPIKHIASVASFFLSRIDVLVDPLLEKLIAQNNDQSPIAQKLQGQVAIASAKIAYQINLEIIQSDRFQQLANKGAQVQRLLWASTSTKNPSYKDTKYVEALIGPKTVNTVPMETFTAYRDHGDPKLLLEQNIKEANDLFQYLPNLGISIEKITQQLENEGVVKFEKSFDALMDTLKRKML